MSYTPSLSSLGSGSQLQITGLASGIDTNAIINALMAIDRVPVTQLTNQQKGLQALNSQLTAIQSSLQTLSLNAQALRDPGLFSPTQTVSSSNSALVGATTTSSVGAVVGSYQVGVEALATPSQRTVAFTSPAAGDTFTIDGEQVTLAAKATAQDFVNAVNSDPNATVWATVTASDTNTGNGTVVLSTRATGQPAQNGVFITIADAAGTVVDQPGLAVQGVNAHYTLNGNDYYPSSNTVANAIPGVTLSLNALTTTNGDVTINVGAPAPNVTSIQAAVKTFVDSYNSIIDQVNTQLKQKPSTSDPTVGTLFGDNDLENMLTNMRQLMYTPGKDASGNPLVGITSLADIGVTTGAASGSAAYSQASVDGKLTIDTTALANAIQSNPSGVKAMLQSWSNSFQAVVDAQAQIGGSLDARIQGGNTEISDIGDRIDSLNQVLADRQTALQQQFANLEAALSQSQSEGQWLASQIASLPLG